MKIFHQLIDPIFVVRFLFIVLFGSSQISFGQLAEDVALMATDPALIPPVPSNPSLPTSNIRGTKSVTSGAILLTKDDRTSTLSHESSGGEHIESNVVDESTLFYASFDMGQGARIAIANQASYRKSRTKTLNSRQSVPLEELQKSQLGDIKITIELTEGLTAGMMLRYLRRERQVIGDLSLGQSRATFYKYNLVGYGSGASFLTKSAGIVYAYFPPLRGKSEVYGEEKIVTEPGYLGLNGFWRPSGPWTLALMTRRFLNEIDDIARGTTAANNQTRISLYGLDPDQYLINDQVHMLGVGFEVNRAFVIKLSGTQETSHFNFRDYLVYNRVDVRQQAGDKLAVTYNRLRAQIQFVLNQGLDVTFGVGSYQRKLDFPITANNGTYQASGKELVASIDAGL